LLYTCNLCAIEVALDRGQGVDTFSRLDGNRGLAEPDPFVRGLRLSIARNKENLDEILAAGLFRIQAEALRQYRSTATMNASAPIPTLLDQMPTWSKAAELAHTWGLNQPQSFYRSGSCPRAAACAWWLSRWEDGDERGLVAKCRAIDSKTPLRATI